MTHNAKRYQFLRDRFALESNNDEAEFAKLAHLNGDEFDAALDAAMAKAGFEVAQEVEPMFWVRLRSDGLYEGPIHNARIERVRKESGGWTPLFTAPQAVAVETMVTRFLGWKLPRYFAPDGGITFHLSNNEGFDLPQCWPIGTNLLTADQAKAMFQHCLGGTQPVQPAPWAVNAETLEALKSLVEIIDKAGIENLSNGVQLGKTSWYVKASNRMEDARAAIAKAEGAKP